MKYLEHNVHHILFTEDYTCREVDPGLSAHSRILVGKGEEENASEREKNRIASGSAQTSGLMGTSHCWWVGWNEKLREHFISYRECHESKNTVKIKAETSENAITPIVYLKGHKVLPGPRRYL